MWSILFFKYWALARKFPKHLLGCYFIGQMEYCYPKADLPLGWVSRQKTWPSQWLGEGRSSYLQQERRTPGILRKFQAKYIHEYSWKDLGQEDFHSSCSQMNDARGQVGSCFFLSERSAARRNAIVNLRLLMSALTSTQHTWSNVSSLMGQGPHPLPPTVVGNTRSKSSWCPGEGLAWCLSTHQSIPVIKVFEDTGSKLMLQVLAVDLQLGTYLDSRPYFPNLLRTISCGKELKGLLRSIQT